MEPYTLITLLIIILMIIAIIVILKRKNKVEERKSLSVIQAFAMEKNSVVSTYDHWNNTLIGIDPGDNKMLFYIRSVNGSEFREAISLAEVLDCHLVRNESAVLHNRERVRVIDSIKLEITFNNKNKPKVWLEFYNSNYNNLMLSGELQLAEKWVEIVKGNIIKKKKAVHMAADLISS